MRHLPNVLTALRIVLTPVVFLAILRSEYAAAFLLGAAAGATDGLDGWLARRFGWSSRLGAILDPLADKSLVALGYLALGFQGLAPWWLVWLVLGRDALILLVAISAAICKITREFPPSRWGKLSTLLQISAAGVILAASAWPNAPLPWLVKPAIWLTAAATLWSGVHYAWITFPRLTRSSAA